MTRGHNGPTNIPLRRTMIKGTVGKVRKPAYDLPDKQNPNHIYGHEVIRDKEGAGEVLGKWVQGTPSVAPESNRSFIETNKKALASGCTTSKDTRLYTAACLNDKKEKINNNNHKNNNHTNNNIVYGIKTMISEDITGLIQADFTNFNDDEKDYPDLSTMEIKGKLPHPRETKASIGKDVRLRQELHSNPVKEFKLSKFKKVESVLVTQSKKNIDLSKTF